MTGAEGGRDTNITAVIARTALRTSITSYLTHLGEDVEAFKSDKKKVMIFMEFDDSSRGSIPEGLDAFAQTQYPSRGVAIESVYVTYGPGFRAAEATLTSPTGEVVIASSEEETPYASLAGLRVNYTPTTLERARLHPAIFYSDKEIALANHILLSPDDMGIMSYDVPRYSLAEWLRDEPNAKPYTSFQDIQALRPSIVHAVAQTLTNAFDPNRQDHPKITPTISRWTPPSFRRSR